MYEIRKTDHFANWLDKLRDVRARARVQARIERLIMGNFGDSKSIGHSLSELRIDYGPDYRVYFTQRGQEIIILLVGGDKSTQTADIRKAQKLAEDL